MTTDPVSPGAADPGAVDPGAVDPGAVDPGAVDPGAVDPGRVTDPAAAAAALRGRVDASTARLVHTAADLTDSQAREASLLPGWSRGHLLSHLARNADSFANLLSWARTGIETPQYPSLAGREQGINEGAGQPAADLLADVVASAQALALQAGSLTAADWGAEVRGMGGNAHPAWYSLWRRLTELEIHHVDLDAGYRPADWPEDFAVQCLDRVAADFTSEESPALTLRSSDHDRTYRIGPAGSAAGPATSAEISGGTRPLLAWLTGRSAGSGLTSQPAGPLPVLPSW